ncbi:MAG: hypothetical protein OCU22_09585, partial [Canidatus Methanoxibalbensis ujae]|nr:hypothetical protein [Candidatus Methanoxibalbensis ujae]
TRKLIPNASPEMLMELMDANGAHGNGVRMCCSPRSPEPFRASHTRKQLSEMPAVALEGKFKLRIHLRIDNHEKKHDSIW